MKANTGKVIAFNDYLIHTLQQCVLLQPLDIKSLHRLLDASQALQLPGHCILFNQGDEFTHLYLLVSGGIKLQRLAPNGDEKVIEIIRPGQTFAEAVLFFGGSRYPVSAVTLSPAIVVAIHAETYAQLLHTSHSLCIDLLGHLSQRLHWMVNEVDRLTLHNATFRLVDYLLSQIPADSRNQAGIHLAAPKHVIASRLSIKPETLSRTLKDLARQGLISLNGSEIELRDIDKLRQLIAL